MLIAELLLKHLNDGLDAAMCKGFGRNLRVRREPAPPVHCAATR